MINWDSFEDYFTEWIPVFKITNNKITECDLFTRIVGNVGGIARWKLSAPTNKGVEEYIVGLTKCEYNLQSTIANVFDEAFYHGKTTHVFDILRHVSQISTKTPITVLTGILYNQLDLREIVRENELAENNLKYSLTWVIHTSHDYVAGRFEYRTKCEPNFCSTNKEYLEFVAKL